MMLKNGYEIRKSDPNRYKYSDAMAEFLDIIGPDYEDESMGDVESPTGYVQRFGRRLLTTDGQGFVDCTAFDDARGAEAVFHALERCYGIWADDEYYEESAELHERERDADCAQRYFVYVSRNELNNLESFDYVGWVTMGMPRGYLA